MAAQARVPFLNLSNLPPERQAAAKKQQSALAQSEEKDLSTYEDARFTTSRSVASSVRSHDVPITASTSVELPEVSLDELFSKIRHNRIENVRSLLQGNCNPLMRDSKGNTMLHICAQNNLRKMASLCLKYGCNINATNIKGLTPLDYCDMYHFNDLASWFIEHGGENYSHPATLSQIR